MKALLHRFRAKALSDRRVLRYAGYAAGELVLVVAGILIALAINNANQTRLAEGRAREDLRQLRYALEQDIAFYENEIAYSRSKLRFLAHLHDGAFDSIDAGSAFEELTINLGPIDPSPACAEWAASGGAALVEDSVLLAALHRSFVRFRSEYDEGANDHLRFVLQNIEPDLLRTLPLDRGLRTDPAAVRREMARPAFVNLVHYQENVWALNERLSRDGLALARRLRTRIGEAEVGGRPVL